MARRSWMQRFARWHIWLGWAVALPLLLWTASGLFMALRPIDEVRGNALRIEHPAQPVAVALTPGQAPTLLREGKVLNQRGRSILLATYTDGTVRRIDLGQPGQTALSPVDEAEARAAAAYAIHGGDRVDSIRLFDAAHPPLDFRKPVAAWQVVLADGTHVYVGRDSGEIEAVRTRWWRIYDVMWGLHIMDPVERENSSHALLWVFATLALAGCVLGTALLFRRRRARMLPSVAGGPVPGLRESE